MPGCSKCPAAAVVHLRYAGTSLCREHFLEFFARRAKQEVAKQGRLPEGTLAVALSGGKDSASALHFLHGLASGNPRIRLVAVTVDEGIAGYRDAAMESCRALTARLGVEWRTVRTRDLAGYTIDDYAEGTAGPKGETLPGTARPACGPCGVFRREGMNRLAQEAGATAIVTGHNLDDMAQTILMNHLKGDVARLARLAPHDSAQDGLVPRLMPFRTIPEKEVLLYAVLNGIEFHGHPGAGGEGLAECPYAARSHRFALRHVLVGLEETTPGTRHALVRGQERLKPILQAAMPAGPMAVCAECGQPTSGDVCAACRWRA
ncbi:MAG: TIGR00269 family protein [Thermoplasmatota archaeon]|nr:TIGR00269 family protein [Halobacteriales archaeon]